MSENKITYTESLGTIEIKPEVIGKIAETSILDIDGLIGFQSNYANDLLEYVKGKHITIGKGTIVEIIDDLVSIDLYVTLEIGKPLSDVATAIQEKVFESLQTMLGLEKIQTNVFIVSIETKPVDKVKEAQPTA